jgi:hypothetical protein
MMRVRSLHWLVPVLGLVVSSQAQPPDRSAMLRITVVGQASIHSDLRKSAPAAVGQAHKYLANADVRFTNLEVAVAPCDAAVERAGTRSGLIPKCWTACARWDLISFRSVTIMRSI